MLKSKSIIESVEHVWSILCSMSSVDQDANNISLFNVVEQLNVPFEQLQVAPEGSKKVVNIPLQIVSRFKRKAEQNDVLQFKVTYEWVDQDGTVLSSAVSDVSLPNTIRNVRIRSNVSNLQVTKPGEYRFKVYVQGPRDKGPIEIGRVPLYVNSSAIK